MYIEQFEVLLAQVGDLPEDQCLGYFLCGLREEISRKTGIHESRTITRAMDLARTIEEELIGYQGNYRPWFPTISRHGSKGPKQFDRSITRGPMGEREGEAHFQFQPITGLWPKE